LPVRLILAYAVPVDRRAVVIGEIVVHGDP